MLNEAIKVNGETMEVNILNLFGFTFKGTIFDRGENFDQDHPNYTFKELEQTFSLHQKVVSMSWTFYDYVLRIVM